MLRVLQSDFDTAQSSQGKLVAAAALSAKMPQILDYVNQRADHADLVRMVADWTRKGTLHFHSCAARPLRSSSVGCAAGVFHIVCATNG